MTNVRETKRADELKPGDWLAAMQLDGDGDKPVEFLDSFPYSDADGDAVLLVYRVQDGVPRSIPADADVKYDLATEDEIAELRGATEREQKIADLRALATWLEECPWLPLPHVSNLVHLHGPEGLRTVRSIAERMDLKLDEHLDDRTEVVVPGPVYYDVIAWHKDGRRPAVPAPIAGHYDTTDPDAGEESCACGAVFERREQLQRHIDSARAVADDAEDDADGGFAFGQDDHLPLHYSADAEVMGCKVTFAGLPRGHGYTTAWEHVTCKGCLAAKPASAE